MFERDKFKVIKILNRRQHTSQVSALDWKKKKKKDLSMKTSIPLFWAPEVKSKIRTIFKLTTDFTLLNAIIH